MFVVSADIIGRNLFDHPFVAVTEVVAYSVAGAVFLQLAHSLHVGRFTRAEMFIETVGEKRPYVKDFLYSLYCLMGFAVFVAIFLGAYPRFVDAWANQEVVGTPGAYTFLIWPYKLVLTVGAAATAVEFFIQFLAHGRDFIAGATSSTERGSVGSAAFLVIGAVLVILGVAWILAFADLSNAEIGILSILGMLIFILAGMHIGIALIVLSFSGIWLMKGDPGLSFRTLHLASDQFLVNYFFGVIPMFVIMGLLVSISDMGRDTFDVARQGLRGVKGGLGVATVAANAVFAAITGTSIASAALFSKIATPEMMRHGYSVQFSVGVVAGSSVLGMLIPPSLLLIIYGFLAEVSVGILFTAAIVPGLILAGAFGLAIVGMAHWWPAYMGNVGDKNLEVEHIALGDAVWKLAPIVVLIVMVLGGIYGGIVTPTEAGAAGAVGALIFTLAKRKLTWSKLGHLMVESGHITVSILFLILAANIYARMLALSGVPQQMSSFIADAQLGFLGFVTLYVILIVLLGMILDSVSIMLIVLPLALPVVTNLGGDPIWFGILTVVTVEIGLLTPPLGLTCFVVKSTLDDKRITLKHIFAGAFPFVVIMMLVTILLIAVPELALIFV